MGNVKAAAHWSRIARISSDVQRIRAGYHDDHQSLVSRETVHVPRQLSRRIPLFRFRLPVQTVDATPSGIKRFSKVVFYETWETVWAFRGAETRGVASLEGRSDVA